MGLPGGRQYNLIESWQYSLIDNTKHSDQSNRLHGGGGDLASDRVSVASQHCCGNQYEILITRKLLLTVIKLLIISHCFECLPLGNLSIRREGQTIP